MSAATRETYREAMPAGPFNPLLMALKVETKVRFECFSRNVLTVSTVVLSRTSCIKAFLIRDLLSVF